MGTIALFNNFRKGKESVPSVSQDAPDTQIEYYQNDLIDNLKDDHQELLSIWTDVGQAINTKNEQNFNTSIRKFRDLFIGHINLEDGVLYLHMGYHYKKHSVSVRKAGIESFVDSEDLLKNMTSFKVNMRPIKNAVVKQLLKWIEDPAPLSDVKQVNKVYLELTQALGARIKAEEKQLYPSYGTIPVIVSEMTE